MRRAVVLGLMASGLATSAWAGPDAEVRNLVHVPRPAGGTTISVPASTIPVQFAVLDPALPGAEARSFAVLEGIVSDLGALTRPIELLLSLPLLAYAFRPTVTPGSSAPASR